METYAKALSFAIPGFVILVVIESVIAKIQNKKINRAFDTISSLSSGVTNTLKSLSGLAIVIVSYEWMVSNIAIFNPESSILLYALAFVGLDFAGYWSHRFNHTVNLLWNRHIIHHSSEEYNLSCALRQSISAVFGIYFFLYIPMAMLGVPAIIVAIVAPIQFFAQFWYHTRLIGTMGWLEHIIVTPSHHRVHHAINDVYIDKNYAQIFIVWDKLFGTFQKELKDVSPVYGTIKPVRTWNPVLINFLHFWQLVQDAWRTNNWFDRLRIWVMPTGWRPKDVNLKFPLNVTSDVYRRPKYSTNSPKSLVWWSWFQLLFTLAIMYLMLVNITLVGSVALLGWSAFLMLTIFSYSALMDGYRWALAAEIGKAFLGIFLVFFVSQSFLSSFAMYTMLTYLLFSIGATVYFWYVASPQKQSSEPATVTY